MKPTPESAVPVDGRQLPCFLAWAYAGLGEKEKALEQARHAIADYDDDSLVKPFAETTLAIVQAQTGDIDSAIAALPICSRCRTARPLVVSRRIRSGIRCARIRAFKSSSPRSRRSSVSRSTSDGLSAKYRPRCRTQQNNASWRRSCLPTWSDTAR